MEGEADGERKVSEYRRMLAEMQNGGQPAGEQEPSAPNQRPRTEAASRHRKPEEKDEVSEEPGPYRQLLADRQNGAAQPGEGR